VGANMSLYDPCFSNETSHIKININIMKKILFISMVVRIYCTPSPLRYALTIKDPVGSGTTM
jgi:hypothetical protein